MSLGTTDVTTSRTPADLVEGRCRPVTDLLQRVGDKWTMLVVVSLLNGSQRFSELRCVLPAVSQRMLTLTLRTLERDGLVTRTVTPSIPPRVDYELTALGRSLADCIGHLGRWAEEHYDTMESARARYDARKR